MVRSPGFGSYTANSCLKDLRPIQTRFRFAYTYRLKLANNVNSLTHYAKGTISRVTHYDRSFRDLVNLSAYSGIEKFLILM